MAAVRFSPPDSRCGGRLRRCRHEELVVGILEYGAHAAANLLQGIAQNWYVTDSHRSLGGQQAAVEMEQQRAFSGSVFTNHTDGLAMFDAERDVAQGGCAVCIAVFKLFDFDDVMAHAASSIVHCPMRVAKWP